MKIQTQYNYEKIWTDTSEQELLKIISQEVGDADPDGTSFTFEYSMRKTSGTKGFADVFKKGCFGWEYKGKKKDLTAAYMQLQQYAPAVLRTHFGYVPQEVSLFNGSLRDNISANDNSVDDTRLWEVIVQCGLADIVNGNPSGVEQSVGERGCLLSGGQRQRVCIAIGLLSNADIIIADEPTSALDPVTEQEILKLIRDNVKQRQIGGLLITHDLHSALACDKLLVIDDGGVVAYGAPKHALESSSHAFCCSLRDLIA